MLRNSPQGKYVNLHDGSAKVPHLNHTKTQSHFMSYMVGSYGLSLTSSPTSFPMARCAPATLSFLLCQKHIRHSPLLRHLLLFFLLFITLFPSISSWITPSHLSGHCSNITFSVRPSLTL